MTVRVPKTTAEERDELRGRAGTHGRDPKYVISVPSALLYGLLDDCTAAEAELTELRHDLADLMNCDYGPKGLMWDGNGENAVSHLRAHLEDLAKTYDTRHPELVRDLMESAERWKALAESLLAAIRMGHELAAIQKKYAKADDADAAGADARPHEENPEDEKSDKDAFQWWLAAHPSARARMEVEFAGKCVAVSDETVVASGDSFTDVYAQLREKNINKADVLLARMDEAETAAPPPHCDECDWTFGCFNGSAPCRKKPMELCGEPVRLDMPYGYTCELPKEGHPPDQHFARGIAAEYRWPVKKAKP